MNQTKKQARMEKLKSLLVDIKRHTKEIWVNNLVEKAIAILEPNKILFLSRNDGERVEMGRSTDHEELKQLGHQLVKLNERFTAWKIEVDEED